MLDISFIRDNKDVITEAARKKRIDFDVEKLITLDDERRKVLQEVEVERAKQNEANQKVAQADDAEKADLINQMKLVKEVLQKKEEQLKNIMVEWQKLMLTVPNIPDMSVPEGESEDDNVEAKVWGEKPNFDFEPKDHIELMLALDMVDFERGTKVHGFRGYFLKGDGALLSWAIWN